MTNLQEVSNEAADIVESEDISESNEKSVVDHLDEAVLAAEKEGMQMSELIGMFFYYAHNLSQQARDTALDEEGEQGQVG